MAVFLAASLWAAPAAAEWVDWIAEADVGFGFDSNLNNSGSDSNEEWDLIWQPAARLGRVFQVADNTRIALSAEARGLIHHRWEQLDSVTGEGQVSLSHKFGLGDAPWGRVFAAAGYEGVQDAERGGARVETGLQIGKRFTPRFDASLSYRWTFRDGSDGSRSMLIGLPNVGSDVWDQEHHEVGIDGRFLVTEELAATTGFDYRRGDLYSNVDVDAIAIAMHIGPKAVAADDAFGGVAYRVVGNVYSPFLSLNYAICDRWSVDTSYRYRYAHKDSFHYENHIAQLTVLFRY